MRMTILWATAATIAAWPLAVAAEEQHDPPAGHAAGAPAAQGVAALSQPLRDALGAEMQAVQAGMVGIIPALAAGNWDQIAAIGTQIRDSYIMRQSLTPAQLQELHDALPSDFLALDARFHQDAGMLVHVAEAKKPELVGYYAGRMMEACVTCHSRHATERFPALAAQAGADPHAH